MKAKAEFFENLQEIEIAKAKRAEGDLHIEIPDEEKTYSPFHFCLSDVVRAWKNKDAIILIFNDGDCQRVQFTPELWQSVGESISMRDKGFRG